MCPLLSGALQGTQEGLYPEDVLVPRTALSPVLGGRSLSPSRVPQLACICLFGLGQPGDKP
jgi:hypothetical protein